MNLWESGPDLALFAAGDRHRGVAAGLANRIKAPLFVRWPHELKDAAQRLAVRYAMAAK